MTTRGKHRQLEPRYKTSHTSHPRPNWSGVFAVARTLKASAAQKQVLGSCFLKMLSLHVVGEKRAMNWLEQKIDSRQLRWLATWIPLPPL